MEMVCSLACTSISDCPCGLSCLSSVCAENTYD
jgi:hypothetical protein